MTPRIEPFYADLGRCVRDLRNKQGMTQEQLGKLLVPPTSRVSVANIEGGHQRILAHTLVQMAAALNADVIDILPKASRASPATSNAKIADELASKAGLLATVAMDIVKKADTR